MTITQFTKSIFHNVKRVEATGKSADCKSDILIKKIVLTPKPFS